MAGRSAQTGTRESAAPQTVADTSDRDPRVARSRAAVLLATLELLTELGFAATSIEGVATRSRVAKTTIYRHWNSRAELVVDAVRSATEPHPIPTTGNLRTDLLTFIEHLADRLRGGRLAGLLPTLVDAAARDPEIDVLYHELIAERRQPVRMLIEAAMGDGRLARTVDAELLADILVGPLFVRLLVTHQAIADDTAASIVNIVLDGVLRRPDLESTPEPAPGSHRARPDRRGTR